MMNRKSITINYLLNTAYQILILIVPLITTPYISRTLGADGVGIYSYTYSIISYFMIFAVLGTTTYGQRSIAYAQNDKYLLSCKFYEIFIIRLLSTLFCILIYVYYLFTPLCKYQSVAWVQLLWLVSVAFDVSWLFQGLEDFKRIVIRNTIAKIFNIILIYIFVKNQGDVEKYAIILSGMTLIANLSVWPYLPHFIRKVKIRDIKPFKNIREIIFLFVPTIAVQVNAVLDKTMIGWIVVNSSENGYYEQTEKVVRMALAIVTSLGTVMIPRIAKLFHEKDTNQMKYFISNSYQFVWLIGIPIMLGLDSIVNTFVPVFYGPGFDRIKGLMPIYSLCVIPVALSNVTGCQFLIPTKRQNVYTFAVVSSAIVNVILNSILIPDFLANGAAAASVIAEYVGCIIMLIYIQKKKLVELGTVFSGAGKKWISGIVMFVSVRLTERILDISASTLIFLIAEGTVVYIMSLLIQKDAFVLSMTKKYIDKIREKIGR